jgi:NAD+ kinase
MYIALFGRKIEQKSIDRLELLLTSLSERGVKLCFYSGLLALLHDGKVKNIPEGDVFSSYNDLPKDVDLFMTLGGDGTFLTSLSIVRNYDIPIVGVNFGRLGFLTAVSVKNGKNDWIDSLVAGKFEIVEKSIIHLSSPSIPSQFYPFSLNEISIQRKSPAMLGVEVRLNSQQIPTYWADGLLVATPTGSTAYSLSVGGPIVLPNSNVFIIAPIAPHNLNIRPIIVPDDANIEISIKTDRDAILAVDNRSVLITPDSPIYLSKASFRLKAVTFGNLSFFDVLRDKLLWGEDKRNNI